MIKLLFFTLLCVQWIKCQSQRIVVVDSTDKTFLSFVAIKYTGGGLYTNEIGQFDLADIQGKTIKLSLLGYKSKQINKHTIKDTVFLSSESTLLNEVVISKSAKAKQLVIKPPRTTKFFGSGSLDVKSEHLLILIPDEITIDTYIESLTFYFVKKSGLTSNKKEALEGVDAVIRINLYHVYNDMPSTKMYASEPIKTNSFKKDQIVLDMTNEFISIPKEGICIGIEMIGYYDQKYNEVNDVGNVRPMLTAKKYEHFNAKTYKNFSFPIDDQKNTMILMSDFLEKLGALDHVNSAERNLSIGLTLSKFSY